MLKFAFDRIIALTLLPLVVVISILCMIIIRIESEGNPLFIQKRIGKNLKQFKLIKLRTMKANSVNAGSHLVSENQITAIGRLLRRTKLDEIPQIWNVLLGHMSFVGPRPCLPSQKDVINCREKFGVNRLRPGITGPSQLAGIDMSTPSELARSDAIYLTENGLLSDILMMLKTVGGKGRGDAIFSSSKEK